MSILAINGGKPVRKKEFPAWPVHDNEEIKALSSVVKSGKWCRTTYFLYGEHDDTGFFNGPEGSKVREFENEFAKVHGAKFATATSNGTSALEIAVKSCGIKAGDEVITSPYSFISTASCILQNNAIPVFADIDPETYNIDPASIETLITRKTKAIIPVHFGGNPADLKTINQIAEKYNLSVIEDACHAHGIKMKKGIPGIRGDMAVFSFQQSKNMTAGEGGIILTNNSDIAENSFSYHLLGRKDGGLWYEHPRLGWNARMTEFQGAILLAQLNRLDEQNRIRNSNADFLNEEISRIGGLKILKQNPDVKYPCYHIYVIKYSSKDFNDVDRLKFIKAVNAEGIPCSGGYSFPLYENELFLTDEVKKLTGIDYKLYSSQCPVAERACKDESIWFSQNLLLGTRDDMEDIIKALQKVKNNIIELQ